jgi:Trk K+ transport system NAD-binding subunit
VVLADTRYTAVARARVEGLQVYFGDILSEETELELPLEQITRVFAATDDDAYNSLVCMHFAKDFGRSAMLQLAPGDDRKETQSHMMGKTPWPAATYAEITRRYWQEQRFKVTSLSDSFGWDQLQGQNPEALFMFEVQEGSLRVLANDSKLKAGAKVIYLA